MIFYLSLIHVEHKNLDLFSFQNNDWFSEAIQIEKKTD